MYNRCQELEELLKKLDYFNPHKNVKVLKIRQYTVPFTLSDADKQLLTSPDDLDATWSKCVEELINDTTEER